MGDHWGSLGVHWALIGGVIGGLVGIQSPQFLITSSCRLSSGYAFINAHPTGSASAGRRPLCALEELRGDSGGETTASAGSTSMLFGAAYGSLLLMLGAVLLVKRKGRSRSDSRGASRSGSEGGASRSEGGQTLEMGIEALSSGMVSK